MRTAKELALAESTVETLIHLKANPREILKAYEDEQDAREHFERSASVRIRKELPAIAEAKGLGRNCGRRWPRHFPID